MRYFWEKVTEEHSPGTHRSWERINTLCSHFTERNLDQNMLGNALCLRKIGKIASAFGGSAPEPPAAGGSASRPPSCYSRRLFQLF